MNIYLVRHGESEANTKPIVQGEEGSLSERGREQAEFLAQRLKNLPIDHILCSTLDRAKETAAIINGTVQKPIDYSALLVEKKYPSAIIGKPEDDPGVLETRTLMREHFGELGWKHSNEENFEEFKARALKALELCTPYGKENLLVITHGLTMRMILLCAILGEDLTPQIYKKFLNSTFTKNTGITVLKMHESMFDGEALKRWVLVTWNDHAHLENV